MAVHITTGRPTGELMGADLAVQLKELQDLFCNLLDQIEFAICNLDAGNVSEAQSVRADRIDTKTAKIVDAQIKSITADKLTAGTIDAEEIEVKNLNADNIVTGTLDSGAVTIRGSGNAGYMQIEGNRLVVYDGGKLRLKQGIDENGVFTFTLYNSLGAPQLYYDSDGNAIFEGNVMSGKLISSSIESYDDRGRKHGLWANPASDASGQTYADLELWYYGQNVFKVTNNIGGISFSTLGKPFLTSSGSGVSTEGEWKKNGSPLATVADITNAIQNHIQQNHSDNA